MNSVGGDNTALVDDVSVQPIANQIADPVFGAVSVGADNWQYAPTGSPWTFVGTAGISGNGSAITSGNPSPLLGNQVAFVQGTGSIGQAVNLSAGSYTLDFSAAQHGNYNQGGQTLEVLVDGTAVGGNITPTGTNYATYHSASFTVTAGTHTITIEGLDLAGGDNTALVDNVFIPSNLPTQFADPGFTRRERRRWSLAIRPERVAVDIHQHRWCERQWQRNYGWQLQRARRQPGGFRARHRLDWPGAEPIGRQLYVGVYSGPAREQQSRRPDARSIGRWHGRTHGHSGRIELRALRGYVQGDRRPARDQDCRHQSARRRQHSTGRQCVAANGNSQSARRF